MTDVTKDRLSVTLKFKQSESYAGDGAWIVLEGGSPEVLKQQVADVVGIEHKGLTLLDVVSNAQQALLAVQSVQKVLSGTVIGNEPASAPKPAKKAAAAPKKAVEPKPAAPAASTGGDSILAAIEACNTKDELTDLWRERKAEVVGHVRDAFKKRGEEVKNG